MWALGRDGSAHGERYSTAPIIAAWVAGWRGPSKRITSSHCIAAGPCMTWTISAHYVLRVTAQHIAELNLRCGSVGALLPRK